MGWSESERGCKRHHQFPADTKQSSLGVCSSCLSEKLSQLYAPSSTSFLSERLHQASSSSHESNFSSASSSTCESPVKNNIRSGGRGHHRRNASEMNVLGSISFVVRNSGGGGHDHGVMKKSRSVAVVSKSSNFGDHQVKKSGKKKRGFWSKLLRTTGNRTKEVLKHSKTSLIR